MEPIRLPNKIEVKDGATPFSAELTVEPCFQGYGNTLGNALRRVLLSSLPGAAVTAIKIRGVDHEFSPIANVQEDVIQLILNMKKLRLRVFNPEGVRLHIKVKGERVVTAADIEASSDVEVVNKDHVIATLTSSDAEFEMDIFARQGRGYMPIEERPKENLEVGVIAIDAVFTPIKNVGYHVDDVRVGQITNFDRLVLNIETDGTILPKEALMQSLVVLGDHVRTVSDHLSGNVTAVSEDAAVEAA